MKVADFFLYEVDPSSDFVAVEGNWIMPLRFHDPSGEKEWSTNIAF